MYPLYKASFRFATSWLCAVSARQEKTTVKLTSMAYGLIRVRNLSAGELRGTEIHNFRQYDELGIETPENLKDATKEQKDEFWKNQEIFQINWRAAKKSLACDQKYTIQIRLSMRPMINEMERLAGISLGVLFLLQRTYNEDTDTASTISEEEMLDIWNMLQKLDEGRRTIELAWKGLILGEIEEWKKVKEATYIQTKEKKKKEMNEAREALAKTTEATFDIWESMMKKK